MQYMTKGTCARAIEVELDGTKIKEVSFYGGCHGNLQGISKLVVGVEAADVIEKFKGIKCGYKPTSCPDQLALALEKALSE